jgi:glycosyltransferase involved in cell wall biosynthesis
MNKIGILLPAYNEEKNIQIVIREAKKILPNSTIVVVDDGSKDKTSELAKKSKVMVIRHDINKGKGEALNTGFKYFSKKKEIDYIIIADTDRQYQIKEADKILKPLEEGEADYVTGYRISRKIPYANRMGNFIWRVFFNLLFKTHLKDVSCGFIGMKKTTLRKMKNIQGGYIIESSMLRDVIKNKLRIKQVPVRVVYKKRRIIKYAKMFFGVLFFILVEGFKFRLGIKS